MRTLLKRATVLEKYFPYLLYDTFSKDTVAGAVNGTFADTGQQRTVVDGNSKLSIAAGVASFATGGVGSGNPGLWYPLQTRIAGSVLLATLVNNANVIQFGWGTAQSGTLEFCIRPISGTGIGVRDNIASITVAPNVGASAMQYAVVLRVSGCFYFAKGSVFTNWTLIWYTPTTSSNMYPGVQIGTATDVFTIDNVRVPVLLYIPNPLAYDTFTRSNGVLGSSETTGPDSQVITALTWLFTTGIWVVASNLAVGTPATLGSEKVVNGAFAADTDWTKGSGWTIGSGTGNASAASSNLSQTVAPLTASFFYKVVYTLSAFAAGTVQAVVGGKAMPTHGANATYTEVALATTTAFLFTGAGFTGSLDNVSCKALTWAELFASVLLSTADVIAEAAITLSGASAGLPAGLGLNLDSTSNPQNFVLVYLDGNGNCVIAEMVSGTITIKQTTAITYSAGAVLRVIRSGTECRVFYNNAAVGSAQTMTANVNLNHGLFSGSGSNSLDAFLVWARGSENNYGALDAF